MGKVHRDPLACRRYNASQHRIGDEKMWRAIVYAANRTSLLNAALCGATFWLTYTLLSLIAG